MKCKEWYTLAEFAAALDIPQKDIMPALECLPEFVASYCQNISLNSTIKRYLFLYTGFGYFKSLYNFPLHSALDMYNEITHDLTKNLHEVAKQN